AVKALSAFENVKKFQDELDELFMKEKDPYVQQALFAFVAQSKNEKVFQLVKRMIHKADDAGKINLTISLLQMSLIKKDDVVAAHKFFVDSVSEGLTQIWLKQAKRFKMLTADDVLLALKMGKEYGASYCLELAASMKIDLLAHLKPDDLLYISPYEWERYFEKYKIIDAVQRRAIVLKLVLNTGNKEFVQGVISFLKWMPKQDSKTEEDAEFEEEFDISSDFSLSNEDFTFIRKELNSKAYRELQGVKKVAWQLARGEALAGLDVLVKQALASKQQSEWRNVLNIYLKNVGEIDVKKHEKQLFEMFAKLKLDTYEHKKLLTKLSYASLKKIYANTEDDRKGDFLKLMAVNMTLSELKSEMALLKGKGNLSLYEVPDILGPKMKTVKAHELGEIFGMFEGERNSSYYVGQLIKKIPQKVRGEYVDLLKAQKVKYVTAALPFVISELKASDFALFKKLILPSELQFDYEVIQNVKKFSKPFNEYLQKNDLNEDSASLIGKLAIYLPLTQATQDKVLKDVLGKPRKVQEIIFQWMESTTNTSAAYYAIYKNLLNKPLSKALFSKDQEKARRRRGYGARRGGSTWDEMKRLSARMTYGKEVSLLLKPLILKQNKKNFIHFAGRLSKLVAVDDYVKFFAKYFASKNELLNFLPQGPLSDADWDLLERSVDLQKLSFHLKHILGGKLTEKRQKLYVAAVREVEGDAYYPFISQ
ncbi:MAG: hypothetical protein HRT88_21415, partial [Lentisphaeraceae bacterium]|nr:hypothetical protein [Lentisphaeraceae bacterium]